MNPAKWTQLSEPSLWLRPLLPASPNGSHGRHSWRPSKSASLLAFSSVSNGKCPHLEEILLHQKGKTVKPCKTHVALRCHSCLLQKALWPCLPRLSKEQEQPWNCKTKAITPRASRKGWQNPTTRPPMTIDPKWYLRHLVWHGKARQKYAKMKGCKRFECDCPPWDDRRTSSAMSFHCAGFR